MADDDTRLVPEPDPGDEAETITVDQYAALADDLMQGEDFTFTSTGWIRVRVGGDVYRLRRPFFGELKKLRLALEAATDEISDKADEADKIAEEVMAMARRAVTEGEGDAAEKRRRTQLKKRSRTVGRDLTDLADNLRIGWWTLVFETLCVDRPAVPVQWPSWVVDPNLPAKAVQHWRSVPLGPGQ